MPDLTSAENSQDCCSAPQILTLTTALTLIPINRTRSCWRLACLIRSWPTLNSNSSATGSELLGVIRCYWQLFQNWIWPRFDLGSPKYRNVNGDEMELEWTWNGDEDNLEMTWIINKAKLTRTLKIIMRSWPPLKIQVDHLCKNEISKTQNSSWPGA